MALTSKSKYADQYVDPVGKSVPRLEGRGVVTGQLKYAFDLNLPNMLIGKMLRSPHAHAKILSIDTSKAEALPGVKAIITGRDTYQIKFGSNEYFFPHTVDQMALETDKVRYIGDEVAAVAAIDEETVDQALKLIDVKYEILPAVFDLEEAIKPGAPAIHEALNNIALILPVNFGNPERLMKESDLVREDKFWCPV
ncbi:MAG: 4-hydroxybenzoyl-CoA reductase subunit alpha, partial [Candidatus Omnitrophota bacterium]